VIAAASPPSPVCAAQDNAAGIADLQAMQQAARKDKRALVADKLQLTPAEAKKFWPVYDTCRRSSRGSIASATSRSRSSPTGTAAVRRVREADRQRLDVDRGAGVKAMRKAATRR
jgi:hypothetical protein